jgi:tetratricopeptide (TPR) repeat protein
MKSLMMKTSIGDLLIAPYGVARSPRLRSIACCAAVGVAAIFATTTALPAQERDSAVTLAIRHREAGRFEAAIQALTPRVERAPQDREAARLLAQTLYWVKRNDDARSVYAGALARHPDDAWLRLEYAQMLAELGERRRARDLLQPLEGNAEINLYADALLGAIAYWDGNFTKARRLLRSTLRRDSTQADARRQLGEIAVATAPWISAGGDLGADNQPYQRQEANVTSGFTLTPNLWLFGQAATGQLESADALTLGVTRASAGAAHYAAAIRLETEVVAGVFHRGAGTDAEWTGRARIGIRLPRHLTVRAIAQRDPYLATLASVRTPVMTRTGTALVALATPRGWLGEAALQRVTFPDANVVRNTYVWFLAPLRWTERTKLQAGYGLALEDADESRWVLADPNQAVPPGGATVAPGVYDPYFTPAQIVVHSVLAAIEQKMGRATMRLGGSYGAYATDLVPVLLASPVAQPGNPSAVTRQFAPRQFTPWTLRGGFDFSPTSDLTFGVSGNVLHTVFFTETSARAVITYRLASDAVRRATRSVSSP